MVYRRLEWSTGAQGLMGVEPMELYGRCTIDLWQAAQRNIDKSAKRSERGGKGEGGSDSETNRRLFLRVTVCLVVCLIVVIDA